MSVRVWDSPFLHRFGSAEPDARVARTVCGVRFVWTDWSNWPKDDPRPRLPRCAECR